jgi:hypothetical protein
VRHGCKEGQFLQKIVAAAFAESVRMDLDVDPQSECAQDVIQYTFMAWNPRTVALLSYSSGDKLPAYFTWSTGIGMQLIDLMRDLFDKGTHPGSFANILLEMHTKRRSKLAVKYEKHLLLDKALNKVSSYDPYLSFTYPTQYCGHVPTGQNLSFVLNKFRRAIKPCLDLEVKKRGGKIFAIDAQFKDAKHYVDTKDCHCSRLW